METYYGRFLWTERKEDIDSCAERLSLFLSDLEAIDPFFLAWRDGDKPKKEYRLPMSRQQLVRILEKNVNRKDIGGAVIPELGFAVSLIAETQFSGFVLRVRCGGFSPWTSNCCSIEFPTQGEDAERILQIPSLVRIANAVIRNWHPQHGVITSHQCSKHVPPESFFKEVGWITYLSRQYGKLPKIPSRIEVEVIEGGHLIITTRERFSCGNPAHVEAVTNLSSLLGFDRKK
jgi:hypothetical protein